MPKKLAKNEEKLWVRRAGWHNLVNASQYQIHLLIFNIVSFSNNHSCRDNTFPDPTTIGFG